MLLDRRSPLGVLCGDRVRAVRPDATPERASCEAGMRLLSLTVPAARDSLCGLWARVCRQLRLQPQALAAASLPSSVRSALLLLVV